MPENDITKMKVADLKRELKLRGLATTGNKNELQDRLQTALIDGDLSLEDSAIAGDDLLDEDGVLTDEEEEKILGDENELLKSPLSTTSALSSFDIKTAGANAADDAILESPTSVTASKKIVIKRKNSFSTTNISDQLTKENTEPTSPKTVKVSHHIQITMGGGDNEEKNKSAEVTSGTTTKMTQLSLKERLEMRAKKFGLNANTAGTTTTIASSVSSGGVPPVNDEKQIELLKKRAERFGCVVSSKIAKITADEKLLKRKERFGGEKEANTGTTTATTTNPDAWSEKARQRLERFKTTPTTTAVEAPAAVTTAAGN